MRSSEIERYYKITHRESWHGGSARIKVAVTDETEDKIEGFRFRDSLTRGHQAFNRITVMKENVAAWEEFEPLPDVKSAHKVREDYVNGRIDEEEMEKQLEEAKQ